MVCDSQYTEMRSPATDSPRFTLPLLVQRMKTLTEQHSAESRQREQTDDRQVVAIVLRPKHNADEEDDLSALQEHEDRMRHNVREQQLGCRDARDECALPNAVHPVGDENSCGHECRQEEDHSVYEDEAQNENKKVDQIQMFLNPVF